MKRVCLAFAAIASMLFGMCLMSVGAVAEEEDLISLNLEQLMSLRLGSTTAMGIHHTHAEGEWMVGYGYMFMKMDGLRDGTSSLSQADVLQDFMVTPTEMHMSMHMLHLMYGLTDNVTFGVMVPYIRKSMDHVTRMGAHFTTKSEGVGDVELQALYSFFKENFHELFVNASITIPTGSINEMDDTPMGLARLPYPMQIGSGTVDLLLGATYLAETNEWYWGLYAGSTISLGENKNNYRLGNRYVGTVWVTRQWTDWFATTVRIDGRIWNNIHGADPMLNPMMVPTADPSLRAGERIDLSLGVSLLNETNDNDLWRLSVEVGMPIYESLVGPQLETDWFIKTGLGFAF